MGILEPLGVAQIATALIVFSIVYIALRIFLQDKYKDVALIAAFSVAILILGVKSLAKFVKSFGAFFAGFMIFIFFGVLIFALFVEPDKIKQVFASKSWLAALIVMVLLIGVVITLASILMEQTYNASTSNQTSNQTPTGLQETLWGRILFNPKVFGPVAFLFLLAIVAYLMTK